MSHAPIEALERRQEIVRDALSTRGLDALVVTALPNILYLTNFTGSTAIAVLTADRVYFLTDFRYVTALADSRGTEYECPALELVTVEGSYDATLAGVLVSSGIERAGFEAAHLTVSRHNWLNATLSSSPEIAQPAGARRASKAPDLLATEGIVETARVRKDSHEIATLREAALRLSEVANGMFEDVRRGRTEREVALAIDNRIRRAGFSRPAFDTIVAAGPNAALPHAQPGERRLTEGDLVVLDFGGVYDSYCVDLTRTVSVGPADARAREVYNAVRDAHRLAIAAVGPGRSRFEIDAAARDALGRHGLGEAFGHGTGHGLGIEVHEDPRISKRRPGVDVRVADEAVAPGMVFTIEPGAYLPGWGGVRIEDDVLVTDSGVDVLTDVTRELIET
jgi:Xaa-Pro aminopeptidase